MTLQDTKAMVRPWLWLWCLWYVIAPRTIIGPTTRRGYVSAAEHKLGEDDFPQDRAISSSQQQQLADTSIGKSTAEAAASLTTDKKDCTANRSSYFAHQKQHVVQTTMTTTPLPPLSSSCGTAENSGSDSSGSSPRYPPLGSYPNPWTLTARHRESFHPVVHFPRQCWQSSSSAATATAARPQQRRGHNVEEWSLDNHTVNVSSDSNSSYTRRFVCRVAQHDSSSNSNNNGGGPPQLATLEEWEHWQRHPLWWWHRLGQTLRRNFRTALPRVWPTLAHHHSNDRVYVGRYDEDRTTLYSSSLFEGDDDHDEDTRIPPSRNDENPAENYHQSSNNTDTVLRLRPPPKLTLSNACARRTVHTGVDLAGPVGTPVYAFTDGWVHSCGYNPELGDYGHVVVIEHNVSHILTMMMTTNDSRNSKKKDDNTTTTTMSDTSPSLPPLFALYGHLDAASSHRRWSPGDLVRRGSIVGWMGSARECGGWQAPHVHFQLSVQAPSTPHDMPGAVCREDRAVALHLYPDPRLVVGELF